MKNAPKDNYLGLKIVDVNNSKKATLCHYVKKGLCKAYPHYFIPECMEQKYETVGIES